MPKKKRSKSTEKPARGAAVPPKKTGAKAEKKAPLSPEAKKRRAKLLLICAAVLLPVLIIAGAYFGMAPPDPEKNRVQYSGQIVSFGSYPQSRVTDAALLAALNGQPADWHTCNDCFSGGNNYGTMQKTDCMQYADVTLDGARYRAVRLNAYRSAAITDAADAAHSLQDDNGYTPGNTYWFRWEPIRWYVADEKKSVLLSEKVLDATQINDAFYFIDRNRDGSADRDREFSVKEYLYEPANIYARSDIRARLNGDFYGTAFTEAERKNIRSVTHRADEDREHTKYVLHGITTDRVWLYSAAEAECWRAAGASDDACFPAATDYALCRGAYQGTWNGRVSAWWWLRSPGDFSGDMISIVDNEMFITSDRQFFNAYTVGGVRCAVRVRSLSAAVGQ